MSMTVDEARERTERARRAIEVELASLAAALGPGWSLRVNTSWIDVTTMGSPPYAIPRVELDATLEALPQ